MQPGEQHTYESYFVVGKGDVASVYDAILEQRGTPTGTFGGRVVDAQSSAPVADANVIVLDAMNHPIDQIEYRRRRQLPRAPAGGHVLVHRAAPTIASHTEPQRRSRSPRAQQTGVLVQMDAPATIAVSAVDEQNRHAPIKIQLLGHDARIKGIDGRNILYSLHARRARAADRVRRHRSLRRGRVVDGRRPARGARSAPARTTSSISRGPEYELTTKTITLAAGRVRRPSICSSTRSYDQRRLGRRRLPHPRAAVDRQRPADRRSRHELRRRGPRGRGRDRSQLHHRLRAGDRELGARPVAARHPRAWS